MAVSETIQEILDGIDESQYGRDMRQYIHKGIQKCYEEGSAGETDLTARDAISDILDDFATVESSTTASKEYVKGELLVLNNTLYKATDDISQGGTITVGTNVKATSIQDAIQTAPDFSRLSQMGIWSSPDTDKEITIQYSGWYMFRIKNSNLYSASELFLKVENSYEETIFSIRIPSYADAEATSGWMYFEAGEEITVTFNMTGNCELIAAMSR